MSSAVLAPDTHHDPGVVWHYGDPFGEQRSVNTSGIMMVRSNRKVLKLEGSERQEWLHKICTQSVQDLAIAASTENLALDSHGHIQHHWFQTEMPDATYLDTESAYAEELVKYLTRMIFWADVQISVTSFQEISFLGSHLSNLPLEDLFEINNLHSIQKAVILPNGAGFLRRSLHRHDSAEEFDLCIDAEHVSQWYERLIHAGLRRAGLWAFEAYRVAALHSRLGLDTDHRSIPHEHNWVGEPGQGAVHLQKGCYTGQEVVSRIHHLGKPPRMLVLLHLDGSMDRPVCGDVISLDDHPVGRLGTVIDHYELGLIALGLVKRSTPTDASLVVTGDHSPISARIDPDHIPPPDTPGAGRLAVERFLSQH